MTYAIIYSLIGLCIFIFNYKIIHHDPWYAKIIAFVGCATVWLPFLTITVGVRLRYPEKYEL